MQIETHWDFILLHSKKKKKKNADTDVVKVSAIHRYSEYTVL